jgi:cell wall-associated NlpC family hydrolase
MLDKEYVYGMQDEHAGFDCSGLVQFVYFEAGVRIPRTVKKQYDSSRRISLDQLQPADLVFFSTFAAGPTHVGIFIGGGKFIHAPSEGKKVEIKELDNVYWNKVYYGAGSFF